jgi:hypothetical protein
MVQEDLPEVGLVVVRWEAPEERVGLQEEVREVDQLEAAAVVRMLEVLLVAAQEVVPLEVLVEEESQRETFLFPGREAQLEEALVEDLLGGLEVKEVVVQRAEVLAAVRLEEQAEVTEEAPPEVVREEVLPEELVEAMAAAQLEGVLVEDLQADPEEVTEVDLSEEEPAAVVLVVPGGVTEEGLREGVLAGAL